MAEPNYSFRAALHGFNRSDVISFLSELTAAHAAELEEKDAQLLSVNDENTRLKQELMSMRMLAGSEPKEEPAPAEKPVPVEELAPVEESVPAQIDSTMKEQELEAYRRAERFEREARQRASKVYEDACTVVEAAKLRLNEQELQLNEMSDSLTQSMNSLQEMMAQIRTHLEQTRVCMQEMEDGLQSTNE